MSNFRQYMHIERFGTDEVEDIELGEVYVFPKIDGTNGSVWKDETGNICCGSRNRELSIEDDNQGFMNYIINDERIKSYLSKHPEHRIFGEWLIKHSLKTYRENAWKKFYIFDITVHKQNESGAGELEYIPYDIYKPMLDEFNLDYISPLVIIKNGSYDQFIDQLEKNTFLIEDGKGIGEGIVIKNYSYYNKYNRQTWAKIVTSEFKEKHSREMGASKLKGKDMIEEKIADDYVTLALVEKVQAKIVNEVGGWNSKLIPRLMQTVYHEIISEEIWNIVKKNKNPKIDFKLLQSFVIRRIKGIKPDIF